MPANQHVGGRNQERSETQLHNTSVPRIVKALGFTWFLVDVSFLEKVSFPYDLDDFDGIRSTQPTML